MITLEEWDNRAGFRYVFVYDLDRKRWVKSNEEKWVSIKENVKKVIYDVNNAMVLAKGSTADNMDYYELEIYIKGKRLISKIISAEEFEDLMKA